MKEFTCECGNHFKGAEEENSFGISQNYVHCFKCHRLWAFNDDLNDYILMDAPRPTPTPTPTNGRVIQEVPMVASIFSSKLLMVLMFLVIIALFIRLFI